MNEIISQCMQCRHMETLDRCTAFEQIPDEIVLNMLSHAQPVDGDGGIQFEPLPGIPSDEQIAVIMLEGFLGPDDIEVY